MKKFWRAAGLAAGGAAALALLTVGGYGLFLEAHYYRIPDGTALAVENGREGLLQVGETYTALTFNIGFGAYDPDFSFFMDSGRMADGEEVTGRYGKGRSAEAVAENTARSAALLRDLGADFVLLQEVDRDSDRSYHVPQDRQMARALPDWGYTFADNFHSPYLFYPLHDPHGAVQSGIMTLSRFRIDSAVRRSYPVDGSFPAKFFDLDRCFALHRLPVEGGGELVLINSHMSAYDEGGRIRSAQLALLNQVTAEELAKGNYVIVGGDFNHALGEDTVGAIPSRQQRPDWVAVLEEKDLAEGMVLARAENRLEVGTCRAAEIPYEPGVNYLAVVDGFLVSRNIQWSAENIDAGFRSSDHNPVRLTFRLLPREG